ncbi:hypothetical protein [Streptomyces sp. NPDC001678]|uniref:hypothetical protein n=1 Tax=Streptomyces sp. NPDC001678 TaxID=3364599 RepID=UPI0036A160EB
MNGENRETLPEEMNRKLEYALKRIDEVGTQISELDEKLHALLAHLTHSREDLTGIQDEMHRALAEEIEAFVGQKLIKLAYAGSRRREGKDSQRRVAELTRNLCISYLGPAEIDLLRVRRMLKARKGDDCWRAAGQAALQIKKILGSAKARGIEFVWDYDCDPGFPVDESTQRVWSSCDPASDVSFVVVPGYLADGERFLLQQVFTDFPAAQVH